MKKLYLVLSLALPALAMAPQQAAATDNWTPNSNLWKIEDNCNRSAIRAYPDYTPEALAKREAYRRTCLRGSNLPVTAGSPPSSGK